MTTIDFNKKHLRNALNTFGRYLAVKIIEDYANSLDMQRHNEWVGKLLDYKIESYPDSAECKLVMHVKNITGVKEIEFYIPYDSEVRYGDITKGESYIIDYINSGPHCCYCFKKVL